MNKTENPLQVRNFDHVTLIVADIEASRQFYVGVLGMEEKPRPNFSFAGAWFEIGSIQIHVTITSDSNGLAGWGDRKVKTTSRGHHFAFEVDDVHAAHQRVLSLGIEVGAGPKTRPDGVFQLYIYDPDRHLVELFSFPPK